MEEPQRALPNAPPVLPPARSLASILLRRVWIVVLTAGAIFVTAVVVGLVQPKVYRATAMILLTPSREQKRGEIVTPADAWSRAQSDLPMQLRLLRRPEIAEHVRTKLGLDLPAGALLASISTDTVSNTPDSSLLSLNCDDTDPRRASQVANEWAKSYLEDAKGRGSQSVDSALDFVRKQLATVESDLEGVQESLAAVPATGQLGDAQQPAPVSRLDQLKASLDDNRAQQQAAQARLNQTRELLAREPRQIEELQDQPTPLAEATKQQIVQLKLQRQKLLDTYWESAPEVQAIDEQIRGLEAQLRRSPQRESVTARVGNPTLAKLKDTRTSQQSDLRSLEATGAALQQQIAEEERTGNSSPKAVVAAEKLKRRASVLQEVHSMLLSRLYELQIEKAMATPNVQIVQAAAVPGQAIKPQMKTLAGLGLVLGLLLGLTVAVVIDQVEDTFADLDEVAAFTGMRLLGAIPRVETSKRGSAAWLEVVDNPRSAFANAMRMAVSSLRFERARSSLHSLVVTSAGKGEGKTTVTANLAASVAGTGESVLVVDGDLHNPCLHRAFGLPNDCGLSNVLTGQAPLSGVVQTTTVPGVSLLASGPLPPSPADLVAGEQAKALLKEIGQAADVVIWDTPPAAILPEATIIGEQADGVLFVVGRQAKRRPVRQTLSAFEGVGVRVVGLLPNQVRPAGGYYYYYSPYYYRHRDEPDKT